MSDFKILQDFVNGKGIAQLKGLRFLQFGAGALATAESDASTQAVGTFCQVGTVVYYRAVSGQALRAFVDDSQLTAQLAAFQTTISNQIASSNAFIPFDASSASSLPTGTSIKNGQGFYVTASGTVSGLTFTANDVFFSKKDNPTLASDFGDIVPIAQLATSGVAGLVKIATTLAEYNAGIADTNLAVSAPALKLLLDGVNTQISSITSRVTNLENRLNQKFTVELTDTNGGIAESTFTDLQSAINYADSQTATNKKIIVRQDTKITTTIKFKSSILIDFMGHDVYANSDITLFDDSLVVSNNGGHFELMNIKDLVVAISDATGSTNAIFKMTGTGTNRRYRVHTENIYTAISIFRATGTIATGTATSFDLLVNNVVDSYSTGGSVVSNYNDKYGSITAHHSNRLFESVGTDIKYDINIGKYLRCNGFMNSGASSLTTGVYLECPTIVIMMNYFATGLGTLFVIHAKNTFFTLGISLVKATGAALILHFRNTTIRCMGNSFSGNIATYHAVGDAIMNTPATPTGVPVIAFFGTCSLFAFAPLLYQANVASGIETGIVGTLITNIEPNSVVKEGALISSAAIGNYNADIGLLR